MHRPHHRGALRVTRHGKGVVLHTFVVGMCFNRSIEVDGGRQNGGHALIHARALASGCIRIRARLHCAAFGDHDRIVATIILNLGRGAHTLTMPETVARKFELNSLR